MTLDESVKQNKIKKATSFRGYK